MNIALKEKQITKDEKYKNNLKILANQICNAHFGVKNTDIVIQKSEIKRNRIIL